MYFDPYLGAYSESMLIGLWRAIQWTYHRVCPTTSQCLDHIERAINQLESIPAKNRADSRLHGEIRHRFHLIDKFDERYHRICLKLFWHMPAQPLPEVERYGRLYQRIERLSQSYGSVHA